VGMTVKARDDGNYAVPPAALSHVTIVGGLFASNETAIRFGETGKTNAGPHHVEVTFSTILDSVRFGILNESLADISATNIWWGTTNADDVAAMVFDEADDPAKGVVSVDPVCTGYRLAVAVTGCGTVAYAPVEDLYGPMMPVTLRAVACSNWFFGGWTNGLAGDAPCTTVLMTGDLDIKAVFRPVVPAPSIWWVL
jgi:hypothetical protein